ncbi:hypothetical protein, partial [Staphylococcus equorum]|uniref:hypothetical protein n=1 Tax=Staphylococcus equorum TaxID=246432 RepID=UPI003FD72E3D
MKKVNKLITSGAVITSLGLTVGATSHSILADEVQQGNNIAEVQESSEVPNAEQPSEPESPEVPDAEEPSEPENPDVPD